MKRKLLILLSAILILFTSCDLSLKSAPKSKVYFIAAGLGFQNSPYRELKNPLHDAEAMVGQVQELCRQGGNDYEIIWYSDDQTVMNPNGTRLDGNDSSRFSFRHIDNGRLLSTTTFPDTIKNYKTADDFARIFFEHVDSLLTTRPTENDLIIFYFSGHGIATESIALRDGKTRWLQGGPIFYYGTETVKAADNNQPDIDLSYFSPISYNNIFKYLDNYKGRQFCIFDCCYSGESVDNPAKELYRYDHELGSLDNFAEFVTADGRSDKYMGMNLFTFIGDSIDHTFDSSMVVIPKRICLNAATYGQMAMDNDIKREPNITEYGGMTYRLLKYLGYDVQNQRPAVPNLLKKDVTASDLYLTVYNNISDTLIETSTPNITRTSYDMLLWDLR